MAPCTRSTTKRMYSEAEYGVLRDRVALLERELAHHRQSSSSPPVKPKKSRIPVRLSPKSPPSNPPGNPCSSCSCAQSPVPRPVSSVPPPAKSSTATSPWITPKVSAPWLRILPHPPQPLISVNPFLPLADLDLFPPLSRHLPPRHRHQESSSRHPRQAPPKPKPNPTRTQKPNQKSPPKPTPSLPPKVPKDERQKIRILGDSHVRGCSALIEAKVPSQISVSASFVPGAPAPTFVALAKEAAKELLRDDVLVLVGGSNDVELESYVPSLKEALQVIDQQVFVTEIPPRFDVPDLIQVIGRVNKQLRELLVNNPKATWIPLPELPPHAFTKHGLHLNAYGKRLLCSQIRDKVASFLG